MKSLHSESKFNKKGIFLTELFHPSKPTGFIEPDKNKIKSIIKTIGKVKELSSLAELYSILANWNLGDLLFGMYYYLNDTSRLSNREKERNRIFELSSQKNIKEPNLEIETELILSLGKVSINQQKQPKELENLMNQLKKIQDDNFAFNFKQEHLDNFFYFSNLLN